jgi:phosphatidylglycerol---prolipoprotein diacylglyceryl transferase
MHWNMNPVLFQLGPLGIRWYGLFFAIGIILGARALPRVFESRGLNRKDAEPLTVWLVVGMIIGAHFIHLVFYEPRSFIDNPRRIIEIGLGLASHGGGLGAVMALALFCKRRQLDFFRHADAGMIAALWVVPWVRIGNFFNSEIYGRVTDVPWAVIFDRTRDPVPRHPSQLYEAAIGFAILGFAYWLHRKYGTRLRPGVTLFILLGVYFTTRFFIEYVKEYQDYQVFSRSAPFSMGQCLSLPIIALCAYLLFFTKRFNIRATNSEENGV